MGGVFGKLFGSGESGETRARSSSTSSTAAAASAPAASPPRTPPPPRASLPSPRAPSPPASARTASDSGAAASTSAGKTKNQKKREQRNGAEQRQALTNSNENSTGAPSHNDVAAQVQQQRDSRLATAPTSLLSSHSAAAAAASGSDEEVPSSSAGPSSSSGASSEDGWTVQGAKEQKQKAALAERREEEMENGRLAVANASDITKSWAGDKGTEGRGEINAKYHAHENSARQYFNNGRFDDAINEINNAIDMRKEAARNSAAADDGHQDAISFLHSRRTSITRHKDKADAGDYNAVSEGGGSDNNG